VVLGRDNNILLSGSFGERHPFSSTELDGVEPLGQCLVLGDRDPCKVHDPLADARHLFAPPLARWHRIQASVDEYAELDLAPPIESWVMARPFPLTLIVPDRFRFYCHTVSFFLLQVRQILCSGSRHKLAAVPASYSNRPEQRPAARPPHSGLHVWHSPGYPELELALIAIARLDHYLKKNC